MTNAGPEWLSHFIGRDFNHFPMKHHMIREYNVTQDINMM